MSLSKLMRFWRKKPPQALEVNVEDEVTMHESLGYKLIRPGQKRPLVEGFTGDDLHRKSGRWMRKIQIVDRENDRYYKQIVDPATGEILRQCEEPLSEHRGYGKSQAASK